jgi:hypothetical protein
LRCSCDAGSDQGSMMLLIHRAPCRIKITVLCLLACTKAGLVHARLARGPPRWQVKGSGLTKPRSWRGFAFVGQASATINVGTDRPPG